MQGVNTLVHGYIPSYREKTLAHVRQSPQGVKTPGPPEGKTPGVLESPIETGSQQGVTRTPEGKTLAGTED